MSSGPKQVFQYELYDYRYLPIQKYPTGEAKMAAETEKTTVWSVAFVMEDKGSDELHTTTVLAGSRDIAIMAAAAELEIDASATKLVICKPF